MKIIASDLDRFLRFVPHRPVGGCWVWQGALSEQGRPGTGHGVFSMRHRNVYAHRASWVLFRGEIPTSLYVLHRCDNPPCVNPEHLFLGNAADNIRDCVAKGRHRTSTPRGEAAVAARLSEHEVIEIRRLTAGRALSQPKLALRYGVALSTISAIVKRRTWKHLKET